MNSIELTDVEGDALSIITRGDVAWVTCTSGQQEVTVGPFPTRLVHTMFRRGVSDDDSTWSVLLGPTGQSDRAAGDLSGRVRDEAWETFVEKSAQATVREALDSALDVALSEATGRSDAEAHLSMAASAAGAR